MRLTQAICRAIRVRPHNRATVDGDRVRTWAEVADRVARIAGGLRQIGVKPGDRIAILSHNCDAFYEAYFAILWAGGVIVPLNTRLSQKEIAFQLTDCGVSAVMYGSEFAGVAAALHREGPATRKFIALEEGGPKAADGIGNLAGLADPLEEVPGQSGDLAAIFYTGGTTGLPKGVMLSHRNLHSMASNLIMSLKVDESCVNLHTAPMFHLADIGIVMLTMVAGVHVFARKLAEENILQLTERWGVTHVFTVPAIIDRLVKHPLAATANLSSLRVLGYGGAPMPHGTLDAALARFPNLEFVQGYGMTEMPSHTLLGAEHHRPGKPSGKLRSVGQACYGFDMRIVDPAGRELPRGQVGEIIGRGDNVMMGYWNRPAETAAALRDGWMHTQDAGYMDEDGFVYITDRLKDMIISGGENVYSIEVENALSTHPAVDECAVIGVADPEWGERVHGVIVAKPQMTVDVADVAAHVRRQIAGYKCPKTFEVRKEPLPRSAAGKVLKTELRAPLRAAAEPLKRSQA